MANGKKGAASRFVRVVIPAQHATISKQKKLARNIRHSVGSLYSNTALADTQRDLTSLLKGERFIRLHLLLFALRDHTSFSMSACST